MSSFLQQADVERLIAQPSPHMRAVVAGKLAREVDNPDLSPSERLLAQELVRTMAQDAQMIVRQALAHNMRRSKSLPHDVAVKLAGDVEAVALPILLDSTILDDDDLRMFIRGSAVVKQKAIASRHHISPVIVDEIIERTGEVVVATLMNNASAPISDEGLHKALDRFATSDAVKEGMVKRAKLPISVTERLVAVVSAQMRNYLIRNHELPPAIAAEFAQQSQERATIQLSQVRDTLEIEKVVTQMHSNQRLTPTLVVRALCMGNLAFFEYGLAKLANAQPSGVRALLQTPNANGLNTLWERAGMPPGLLQLAHTALEIGKRLEADGQANDIQRFRSRIIERLLTQMGNASQEELDYVMDLLH